MKKIKLLLIVTICVLINITTINASTKTYERTESNKYGVNKVLPNKNISQIKRIPLVDASEKIYDYADILTDEEEQEVYKYIENFIAKTHIDMAFVSIDEYFSEKQNEDYACDFYDYNDFGIDFQNYSGVLLLRNNNKLDKYYYIATTGLARFYYDDGGRLEYILDDLYPYFTNDNYAAGIKTFVNECLAYYEKGYVSKYKNAYIDEFGDIRYNYHVPVFACTLCASLITLITMLILVKKNKMVRKAITAKEYLDKGSINYTEKIDQFIRSHTTHYTTSSSSGGGGSHGGSSGFGHGGGGRHG